MSQPHESLSDDSPTILVVDVSALYRWVAGRVIEKCGWKAAYAIDGLDALKCITPVRSSAVLTDVQMPNMDGLESVEKIRERFPRIPVLLMTGHGSEAIAVAALRAAHSRPIWRRQSNTFSVHPKRTTAGSEFSIARHTTPRGLYSTTTRNPFNR